MAPTTDSPRCRVYRGADGTLGTPSDDSTLAAIGTRLDEQRS